MTDDYTQAEIVRVLQRLETGQTRLETKFDSLTSGFVTREVFDIQQAAFRAEVEAVQDNLRADIDALKVDAQNSRIPWTSVVAICVSVTAVVLPLVVR